MSADVVSLQQPVIQVHLTAAHLAHGACELLLESLTAAPSLLKTHLGCGSKPNELPPQTAFFGHRGCIL